MRHLYLIRHAESAANAGLPTQAPETIPLTPRGHAQAMALADAFQPTPAHIVHSPFLRACETAAPLIARHPQASVAQWPVQEFTYLNPLAWRGTTWRERLPAVEAYWAKADPYCRDGHDASSESFADLMARAAHALQQLEHLPHDTVMVSHGLFLCALIWQLKGEQALDMRGFRQWQQLQLPGNASVTRLALRDQSWKAARPMLVLPEPP